MRMLFVPMCWSTIGDPRTPKHGYPSVITFDLERSGTPRTLLLYRNDFKQIEFSATNFTPKGDLNPCTDMEGLKAKVQYAEVTDKSVAGQVISVELSK